MGVHLWRPESRAPWYLLAAGVACYVLGDFIYMKLTEQYGSEPPFPSVADIAYYALYPLLGASLFLTLRRQMPGRDRAGLVDAALITVAAAVLSWTFLMAPYASDPTLLLSEKLASIGYPLGDLLLIALLVRLLLTPGARVVTFRLLVAALVVNLVADIVYFSQLLAGTYRVGRPRRCRVAHGLRAVRHCRAAPLHAPVRAAGRVRSAAVQPAAGGDGSRRPDRPRAHRGPGLARQLRRDRRHRRRAAW